MKKNIILASASPRRSDILKTLGADFTVMTSDAEEKAGREQDVSCVTKAMRLACIKASDVAARAEKNGLSGSVIIGADTIVAPDPDSSRVFEKPADEADAFRMLRSLSGRRHYVISGVCVIDLASGSVQNAYEKTAVYMADLADEDILKYIRTGEPLDKAGAYGIQGRGGLFVKKIEGCYFNVVGLPVYLLSGMLKKCGIELMPD